ncbi:MAG: penicillin-binding transpeptidase domain-containing protein [Firmicutes bacterium]|nr:penicillin-binding transpeptidase domain-containing protein [Bacillota bacterium]
MAIRYTKTSLIKRVRLFLIGACVILTILGGRLMYIQIFSAGMLQLRAAEQWHRDLPLMARRGNIYDRMGRVMVQSVPTYSVYVRPVAVTDPESVARTLSSLMDVSHETVLNRATNRGASEWLVKMQVSRQIATQIIAANLDGVFLSQSYRRSYPMGSVGGQVLGLVSVDNVGQEGLEAFYNQILRGTDGRVATPSDLRGRPLQDGREFYFPSVPGFDLHLHTDATVQNILQTALARALYDHNAVGVGGIVYDIQTGGIVASAAAPFFDMNDQPRDNVSELLAQAKNLPIVNVFEPGSTFKILTLAIALELGLTNEAERFNCPGFRIIGGERVRCWKTKGHGTQDLAGGVRTSCNAVFMDLSQRIGVARYYEFLAKLGIGQKSGVDFFGESAGLVLPKQYVREVDLARIGFGQAIATSPIQFVAAISAILGDGILRTPRFVSHIPQSGTSVTSPVRGQRIVSAETSRRVRELLYGVVNEGSGRHSQVPGFAIGGKTGTAQKYEDGIIAQGKYISSFISFISVGGVARYTVFFYVDQPSRMGYYGSLVAAPYVGQIFASMVEYLNLTPDPALVPSPQSMQQITIPSVAGLTTIQAMALLRTHGFFVQVSGEGVQAIGTFPAAGERIRRGNPVVIRTA